MKLAIRGHSTRGSEVIALLEMFGYNQHPSYNDNGQYLYLNRGFYHTNVVGYSEEIERMIDCGTNEELFLALAALRDDSDKKQWFVHDYQYQKVWIFSEMEDYGKDWFVHKATIEEIIEHFKDK